MCLSFHVLEQEWKAVHSCHLIYSIMYIKHSVNCRQTFGTYFERKAILLPEHARSWVSDGHALATRLNGKLKYVT